LTPADARTLVEYTPDYLNAKEASQCPKVEVLWANKSRAAFQVRSHCPKGTTGLIGNYFVDLRTGVITRDIDSGEEVDSGQLRTLRKKLLTKADK
jgi:hypothetical protein